MRLELGTWVGRERTEATHLERFNEALLQHKLLVNVVQLRHAHGCCLSHIRIVVLEALSERITEVPGQGWQHVSLTTRHERALPQASSREKSQRAANNMTRALFSSLPASHSARRRSARQRTHARGRDAGQREGDALCDFVDADAPHCADSKRSDERIRVLAILHKRVHCKDGVFWR